MQSQSQDLTFVTNEKNQSLANRFRTLGEIEVKPHNFTKGFF